MSPFRRSGRIGGDASAAHESLLTVEEIRVLQRALAARGYDLGPSGADGVLGAVTSSTSKTRAAIRAFQTSQGIASPGQSGYGMLGPRTQTALAQAVPAVGRDYAARGTELFSIGSYAAAATAFEDARQASGNAALYFNIARSHEMAGDDAAAVRAYHALLAAGSPGVVEQEVRRRLEGASARLATVQALGAPRPSPVGTGAGAGLVTIAPRPAPVPADSADPVPAPATSTASVLDAPAVPRVVPSGARVAAAVPVLLALAAAAGVAALVVISRGGSRDSGRELGGRVALVPRRR